MHRMGDYNIIEYGYNIADETINFGTRSLGDGDNLYEAATLATLRCQNGSKDAQLQIKTVIQNNCVFFSINSSLRVFKDKDCSEIICNSTFDSVVDTFCLSGNGRYLFVGLRSGTVCVIDCNHEYRIMEHRSLTENMNQDHKFFVDSFLEAECRILTISNSGKVYRMALEPDLIVNQIYDFNLKVNIASYIYPVLLANGQKLAAWNVDDNNCEISDQGVAFKAVFPLNQRMFVGLDFEGNLFRLCANSLLVVPVRNETLYQDIVFLTDANSNTKQVIVVAGRHELGRFSIQLLSYPKLEEIFSLKVSSEVYLILPETIQDEILYIAKVCNGSDESELRFLKVYETEPEQRLYRLLRKQKYEEAEIFVKLFKLDLQIINKYKAQIITEKSICDSKDIADLIQLLDSIDDDEFKLKCCFDVESSCYNFIDIKRVLNYGCKLVPKAKQDNKSKIEEIQTSVAHLMFRLETFQAINQGADLRMQDWLQFAGCDFIEKLKFFLRNFQIEEAIIIYSRLDECSVNKLSEVHTTDILDILNKLPIEIYQPFLATFVPITLQHLPQTLSIFVKWIYNKVFHLEKNGKEDFPNNAIVFTEKIVKLLRVENIFDISVQRQCTLQRDSISELSTLLSALKILQILKEDYRISIPIRTYLSGTQNVIRKLLNIGMCPEDYDIFLKEFLLKYMLEKQLDPGEIFLAEIIDLTEYEENYWIHIVGSILCCISNVELKLEAIKRILDTATVPWCDRIRKIANEALAIKHHLVGEIRELIRDEPVQVVLRKPKYKIKEKRLSDVYDLEFVTKRIIYCNQDSMVADVLQLCTTPEFRHEANLLLIHHFIRTGKLEEALAILDSNSSDEILQCAQELVIPIECYTSSEERNQQLRENYCMVSKAIFDRLNERTVESFQLRFNKETFKAIQNSYNVSKNFNINVSSDELRKVSHKRKVADKIMDKICKDFENNEKNIEEVFETCNKLTASLSLNTNDVLITLCKKLEDYNIIFKSSSKVYENEESSKNLCLMAVLLLKYVGTYKIQTSAADDSLSDSDSFIVSDPEDFGDNDVFLKGLQLSEKIVAKAVALAKPDEVSACLEVANWVNISFYCNNDRDNDLKKILFGASYESTSLLPGNLTFLSIKSIFDSFSTFITRYNEPNMKYLTYFSPPKSLTEEQLFSEINSLINTIQNLCKEGQHFTAFKAISVLLTSLQNYASQINRNILNCLQKLLKKQAIPKLLQVVVGSQKIDCALFYNLLLSIDHDDSIKFVQSSLRMYKRDPKKFYCIAQTGIKLWNHLNMSSGKSGMVNVMLTLKWWNRFNKNRLNYDYFFKTSSHQRLEILMGCDNFEIKMIEEYCIDFQLDLLSSNFIFLKRTLCDWRPDYEIKTTVDNRRHLCMINNENLLFDKCLEIINIIKNPNDVKILINSVWNSINNYYYEVFITMFNILNDVDPTVDSSKKVLMLIFLKNYQRISKPSEAETEQWYGAFPDTQSLDPLSEFRLPFTQCLFTKNIWDIIRPEVNLRTYVLWFGAISINNVLNKNDICSYVAKEVISSGVISKSKDDSQWILFSKYEDFFLEVDECIKHISDLERATSSAYHIMSHTPKGADQVRAAKLCYKYAVKYQNSSPDSPDVEKAFIKVQKKYFSFTTTHILHMYQLADEKYTGLVSQPSLLIASLYEDERILHKTELVDLQCPDINKAVDEIAELYALNAKKIRLNLVNSWLSDEQTNLDFDSSIICTENGGSSDEDNLKRAAYVSGTDMEFWRAYLLNIGLDNESEEQKSVSCKVKALKLFVMITDVDNIVEHTGTTYDELVFYIDKLTIVHNLQFLGIGMEIENLDNYNKKELLTKLCQRAGNLLAIKTMAVICVTYKIYDIKYWGFIVNSSIKYSMYAELKSYVYFLKKEKYQNKQFYINAWQKLIDNDVDSLKNLPESQLQTILLNHFLMIQSCPVVYSLHFETIFKKCINLGKPEFAAILLQYVKDETKDEFLKKLANNNNSDFGANLKKLAQEGVAGTTYIQNLLSSTNMLNC